MKVEKCSYGYLKSKKKLNLLKLIAGFVVMLSIFIAGLIIFKTRNNYCTLVAVVLALPVGKFAVEYFILLPHKSIDQTTFQEVENQAANLIRLYDCVFSNNKKPIGAQAVVVTESCICALTNETKADTKFFEQSVEDFLKNDKLNVNVTLYTDKKAFYKRCSNLAVNFPADSKDTNQRMQWNADSMKNMCL